MASPTAKHRLAVLATTALAVVGAASAAMLAAAVLPLLPGPAIPIADDAADLLPIIGALGLVLVVPALAFVAAVCWALDRSQPVRACGSWAAVCLAWAALSFMVGLSGQSNARELRLKAYAALARRSQPLVTAIRSYEHDHGQAPPTLAALVPNYLPAVPRLRLVGGYQWDYRATNPWSLGISCTCGFDVEALTCGGARGGQGDPSDGGASHVRALGQWTYSQVGW